MIVVSSYRPDRTSRRTSQPLSRISLTAACPEMSMLAIVPLVSLRLWCSVNGQTEISVQHNASRGPYNDKREAPALFAKVRPVIQPQRLIADAGYDAEWVHTLRREKWGVESFIPPAGHRKDGGVNGKYRSQMTPALLQENGYGVRWLVESFMSGLKRTTGSALRSRTETSLFTEAALRVLAYALRLKPDEPGTQ